MATPRQKPGGRWEIALRHPALPGGRRYYTFDTEAEAQAYSDQWRLMRLAGVAPPVEMLQPKPTAGRSIGYAIRRWASSGQAAPSQQITLDTLMREVGDVLLADASYTWLVGYVQRLKVVNNLAPSSIRHRVQALGRVIDEHIRHHPGESMSNPVKLLAKGYSSYSEQDSALAQAADGEARRDVVRDRRLHPGEEERILAALSGHQRDDKPRALSLPGGGALRAMFVLIVYSGLRLREAYTLTRQQVDMDGKVMRVQSTKQWRGRVAFRDVPMRPEVHRELQDYLRTRPMLPTANLFPFMDEDGGLSLKMCTQRLSDRYRIAFAYAGCQDLREHDLRHEATCRWFEMRDQAGNWLFRSEEVNRIMGWAAGSTMAQRYASFRGADLSARLWAAQAAIDAETAAAAGSR
jgi:integrase